MNVFGFYPCLCLCAFSKTQNLTPELPALTGTTPFYQEQTFLGGEEEDIQREGQNTYKYISRWHKTMHSCLSPVAVRLHVQQLTRLSSANHGWQSVKQVTWTGITYSQRFGFKGHPAVLSWRSFYLSAGWFLSGLPFRMLIIDTSQQQCKSVWKKKKKGNKTFWKKSIAQLVPIRAPQSTLWEPPLDNLQTPSTD